MKSLIFSLLGVAGFGFFIFIAFVGSIKWLGAIGLVLCVGSIGILIYSTGIYLMYDGAKDAYHDFIKPKK